MSKFKIYKASAGSGKTYSLVYEYLKILIADPAEYKHILAVTFTNDATEEMKSRVLEKLKQLTDAPEESPYIKGLREDCGLEVAQIKKRAGEALGNILHDYSNFNISTIDTFFQKVLRAFAKDIGLSAAYNLQLDSETAVQEVTEKVIANTNGQNKQAKWLMKAALEKIEDGKSWNIREELKALFKETFKENYQVKEEKIKESFQNENRIEELQQKIKTEMEAFEKNLVQLASACNDQLKDHGLNKSSFPYKDSSLYAWIVKLSEGIIIEPGVRFLNAIDHVDNWYSKSMDKGMQESIIQAYNHGLNDTLKSIYDYYLAGIGNYNSNLLIKQNLSYFVMFESMVEEMLKYKSENDILFISDTNQFISEVIGNNDESFIFEKAGNYFHHYLIDEFQDTSQLQWKNFKPLISNSVSQAYTSLVVGDVKQSIYRFRNGDWRLLHEQAALEITYHTNIPLKENHRSLENIIQFNNTLYAIAPGIVADIYRQDVGTESIWSSKFNECYTDQEQLVPEKNKNSGGYIKLNLFSRQGANDEEEDHSVKAQKLQELVKDIDDALKRGYQPADIAILVFTKKEAYTVSSHLRKYVEENNLQDKINIVTQSSLNISNSHGVRLVIAALKYLANKKDKISLSNIFAEYSQYFLHTEQLDFLEQEFNKKIEEFKRSALVIKSLPLQILIDHIIRFFELEKESNEHIFLQHFKDAVFDYLRKNADDLSNFMEWWEESYEKFQVEVPQNERSLEIITIHKSKGLQFDLVFIPFAEWGLDSSGLKADMLWLDMESGGVKTLPVKYDKRMQNSSFHDEYLETKFYNYLDKLNLLYVATTRAVKELYIYSDTPRSFSSKEMKPNIKTIFNHLFFGEFSLGEEHYLNLAAGISEDHSQLIIGEKTMPTAGSAKEKMNTIEASISSGNIFETLSIKQQSSDLRDEQGVKYEELKQTGIIFHEVIARSNTKEEAIQHLHKLFLQRKINQETFNKFTIEFSTLFEHSLMQSWLKDYTSYSEYSFCMEGNILKPDKFFLNEQEAIVIDFKTGKPMPEYAAQVSGYCKGIAALFNKPAKGYIYYTPTNQFDPVA
jgi:ATP-dependent helicase/nuclease subunit A